jgi:hypothetical protein
MKLSKLSLAAIVALGALTTTASATPLEEAIKGVDLSGFIRYRFYEEDGARDGSDDRNRFSAPFSFTIPVADKLSAGFTVRWEYNEYAANNGLNDGSSFDMVKSWFKYSDANYNVKLGKFELGTPWTDPGYAGDRGNGLLAFYTGVQGWTFAAGAFTQTNITAPVGGKMVDLVVVDALKADPAYLALSADDKKVAVDDAAKLNNLALGEENVYVAAAIGSMANVNAQLWLARMTNVFDYSAFLQLDTKISGFSLLGQVNMLKLTDVDDDDTGTFYGIQAGYGQDNWKICVGYTSNDDDQPIYALSADNSAMLKYGKQLYYETINMPDADVFGVVAKATFGAYGVEAGYADASIDDLDGNEFYGQVSYKYSKNFSAAAYYSVMNLDEEASATAGAKDISGDNDQLRIELKYTF